MLLPQTYGDELCVHALASRFHVRIDVFTPEYGIQVFQEQNSPTVSLAYNGHDHYDVILSRRPAQQKPSDRPCGAPNPIVEH